MPNVIEAVTHIYKSFIEKEPKMPLHVGEVMNCWTYLAILEETVSIEQSALNTTIDPELREFCEKVMAAASSQSRRLTDFLQAEGVPLPPASEPKPKSDPSAVPMGVKLTDNEIANAISIKLATSIITCASTAAECIRADVGLMMTEFQLEAMTYGETLKAIMKKRGWLKIPPYYYPPGLPKDHAKDHV